MRDYELAREYMKSRIKESEHNRLVHQLETVDQKPNRLLSWIRWTPSASVSSEQITGVPTHQMTPSGTL